VNDSMVSENEIADNIRSRGHPKNTYQIENCGINFYAHLMIQILGLGRTGMDTILGMLGIIANQGSKPAWLLVCNTVGTMQQLLADAVQKENMQIEIERMKQAGITQVEFNGKLLWLLTCSFNMAWQKRATGKCYNSHQDMLSLLVASQTELSNVRCIQRAVPPASCN